MGTPVGRAGRRFFVAAVVLSAACQSRREPQPAPPGSGQVSTKPALERVRLAYNTWVGFGPLFIAQERGFFREAGLAVELRLMEGTGEKGAVLASGQVDAVATTADAFVVQAAQGVRGKIVLAFDESMGSDGIVVRREIRSIADLRGRRVALQPGFVGHFFLLALLKDNGLTPEDITVVPMDTGDAGAAFVAGKVDAAVTWEPWLSKAKERPGGKVLVTSRDKPGLIADVLVVSEAFLDSKREVVQRLVRAWYRAVDHWRANRDEADAIIAKSFRLSPQETKEMLDGLGFFDDGGNRRYFGTRLAPGRLYQTVSDAIEVWFKAGLTKTRISAADLIDPTVVTPGP